MGLASPEEASQLERLLPFYPELQSALSDFGFQLELFASSMKSRRRRSFRQDTRTGYGISLQ